MNEDFNNSKIIKKLSKAITKLIINFGFFGIIALSLKQELTDNIDTAATNGINLYFNPKFLDKLTENELQFVLLHEVMHIAFNHIERGIGKNNFLYNIACDIKVNQTILTMYSNDRSSISIDGHSLMYSLKSIGIDIPSDNKSSEQIYDVLLSIKNESSSKYMNADFANLQKREIDDHSLWDEIRKNINNYKDYFNERLNSAYKNSKECGNLPLNLQEELQNITKNPVNWRIILNNYISDEINDYSFLNPDKRFQDSDILLPSYSEKEEVPIGILFAIDTSGSMDIADISKCYFEVKSAIEQYNGHLKGYLAIFDCVLHGFYEINDNFNINKIKCVGRGGTSYKCIFEYMEKESIDDIKKVIILTDGCSNFVSSQTIKDRSLLYVFTDKINNKPTVGEYVFLDKN